MALRAAGATDPGKRRAHNEDFVTLRGELGLFVVADGAGGHEAGDIAAQAAARSVSRHVEESGPSPLSTPSLERLGIDPDARLLCQALHRAHRDIVQIAQASGSEKGMGTTVVALLFSSDSSRVAIAHVGDSRCYRMRGGHLELLTVDHSVGTDVLERRPDLDDKVLERLPRHVVTRALGMGDTVRVSVQTRPVVAGDRFLLCTDGLSGPTPAWEIAEILTEWEEPQDVVEQLIARANACGGPDNIGVVIVDCLQGAELAVPVEAAERQWREESGRESDPELLILGIEELDLARSMDDAGDDLIAALGRAVERHKP
ncbi:MAG: serine/threonine-protein phosphatase [Polyangiaceae bacterium]|nr:serine/threonine-protein phosphatase [Polyangiaceae bacterium]